MARRSRQISLKECYDILGLQKGADLDAVKSAYRRRAFELHPDLNPGNAEASRQFQILNEAYVALSAMLKPVEEAKKRAEARKAAQGQQAGEKAAGPGVSPEETSAQAAGREAFRARQAYAEQDVLRDLLNDPFAKRVFEDIYSEVDRKRAAQPKVEPQAARPAPPPPRPENRPGKKNSLGDEARRLQNQIQDKGVAGAMKGFFQKHVLDLEETIRMPAGRLRPGARIRIQVRVGLSDEVKAIEVTLPADFAVGKPFRLKGLGSRLGTMRGDLYLTIQAM